MLDLRLPIGLFFLIVGVILVIAGIVSPEAARDGIRVDLYWGIFLLVFGALMTFFGLKGRPVFRGAQRRGSWRSRDAAPFGGAGARRAIGRFGDALRPLGLFCWSEAWRLQTGVENSPWKRLGFDGLFLCQRARVSVVGEVVDVEGEIGGAVRDGAGGNSEQFRGAALQGGDSEQAGQQAECERAGQR